MNREKESQLQAEKESGPLITFQVAKPVVVPEIGDGKRKNDKCVHTMVLMEHVFAFSYGKPFVGMFMIRFLCLSFSTLFTLLSDH